MLLHNDKMIAEEHDHPKNIGLRDFIGSKEYRFFIHTVDSRLSGNIIPEYVSKRPQRPLSVEDCVYIWPKKVPP